MGLPEHTSASQLWLYSSCPRRYRFRYLDDIDAEERSVSLIVGTVVHGAIEWFFEERIAGRAPTVDAALHIAHADFGAEIHEQTVRWGRWTLDDLRTHAQRLVRFFLERHADLPVRGCEERFDIALTDPDTGKPLPRLLTGRFDLSLEDGGVIELKTARSEYTATDLASSLQFGAYSAAIAQLGLDRLDVWVILKNKTPRLQRLAIVPNDHHRHWFLSAAAAIEKAIAARHFPPAPGFGCKTCEYRRRCLGLEEVQDASAEAA